MSDEFGDNDFVVVANRLPVDLTVNPDGSSQWVASPGGLVTALSPILSQHSGCWVGWPGTTDGHAPEPFKTEDGILLHPVALTDYDFEGFYEGFSNATLWPLYHDLIVHPIYNREWWSAYREVNLKFANAVAEVAAKDAIVWVQDYQLQLVPGILRQTRPDLTIGFFLHIPFPSPDLFRQLPWREEVVRGLLGVDLIGFHLPASANNFLELARQVTGTTGSHTGQPDTLAVQGTAAVRSVEASLRASDGRKVGVAAYPISIDVTQLTDMETNAEATRAEFGDPTTIILGVDRLDYTKGILQRLLAFEELLESGALDANDTVLVQVATPSRERIEHYKQTRSEVEEAVGRINGHFGSIGHSVVHYHHRSLSKNKLASLYAAADIMLVTPFKDGMNLVAKEYVACHGDGTGALVLSEFAGAAYELEQAFLCNPFDLESIKKQVIAAVTSLKLTPDAAKERMMALHRQVVEHDVNLWAASFLEDLHRLHKNGVEG
ncbi:alpha,alpha-trehalose-phosphate synthase (UDP-forming) [Corynebacterium pseudotuberculosis]|uniref:alpha,alpha-trehalose-phosphate synthase (UDP-forming) n=1 Tax=Corynebacterium pseudotuberculosis TaxID=1719 RepID=UPI0001E5F23D|nr:trehalose-6-phosphate synthase [Corynebacterium pseudotuberculosis]ADO27010.1 trehalose-6-phosphate synthase [Corynebacterium pseudotuberculosis I19]AFF22900.1 Trehalose-6-phosphate synthase [Corynebacterium pseudotuberculosis P54B96]AFH52702.1 Trehalose-6-phosphate synthase [Corynebacterium pseudotuberculosis 267]AKC74520.1 Trehalose-6-phosphate synthase [Corynebacterium pseudotuberculosis]AKI59262.1 trehalose-6-phosphate synthase [Corynebacterium pseudotuberculosis]